MTGELVDELVEPLDIEEAKALIRRILRSGKTILVNHAKERMASRAMTSLDVMNVLRCGTPDYPEQEGTKYRYRVCTERMTVVVEFRSRTCLVVVTAWRN
jgi:uncharacterized protein DUF4258